MIFAKTSIDSSFFETIASSDDFTTYGYHQQININYQTLKGNGSFGVKHNNWDNKLNGPNIIRFIFNGFEFYCSYHHIGEKLYHSYKESFTINGKTFNDIIILYSTSRDTSSNSAFINQAYGLFHLNKQGNDTLYTLQTK